MKKDRLLTWATTSTIAKPASPMSSPRRRSCLRKKAGRGIVDLETEQWKKHLCNVRRLKLAVMQTNPAGARNEDFETLASFCPSLFFSKNDTITSDFSQEDWF